MNAALLVLLIVGAVWTVLFAYAGREEIADCWRCHRARTARRQVRARIPQQRRPS